MKKIKCALFGHQYMAIGFKYRKCARCGHQIDKRLKGLEKALDESAKEELEINADMLLLEAEYDANHKKGTL